MIDSHCHLEFPDYKEDFIQVLERTKQVLDFVINVGTTVAASEQAVKLAQENDFIYASVGVHPDETGTVTPEMMNRLAELAIMPKVVAIGECGLDYARLGDNPDEIKAVQKHVLEQQLDIATKNNLPVIFHCREAYDDLLKILNDWLGTIGEERRLCGVMHCYVGTQPQAQAFLNLGLYISFTGIITFKNVGEELLRVVRETPLEKILVETDSPFLSPVPYRGKRNEPSYVVEVAKKIAELKNISLEEVDKITTHNARELFGVK